MRSRGSGRSSAGAEITLEANPSSVEAARFRGYRARRRQPRVARRAVARRCRSCARSAACTRRRRRGPRSSVARDTFERFSFDLIYARPGQTLEAWRGELAQALALAGRHLSLYQLTIEPGTPFAELHARGKLARARRRGGARLLRADAGADRARRACRPTRSPTTPRRARSAGTICSTGATASTPASAPAPTAASSSAAARAAPRRPSASRSAGSRCVEADGHGIVESDAAQPEPSRPTRRC